MVASADDTDVGGSKSTVGMLEPGSLLEPPLLHTIEEAAEVLRIGRTLAYALSRRYEETGGLDGSVTASGCRAGRCSNSPSMAERSRSVS